MGVFKDNMPKRNGRRIQYSADIKKSTKHELSMDKQSRRLRHSVNFTNSEMIVEYA